MSRVFKSFKINRDGRILELNIRTSPYKNNSLFGRISRPGNLEEAGIDRRVHTIIMWIPFVTLVCILSVDDPLNVHK